MRDRSSLAATEHARTTVRQPDSGRSRVAVSSTLAILLVLISAAAGAVGAGAWRQGVRDQAGREFQRQADTVRVQVDQHLANLDPLFALSERTIRSRQSLPHALKDQDLLKKYPGVMTVGEIV